MGAEDGGYISVKMSSFRSERSRMGKSLGQVMEKTAISLGPWCRTLRISWSWPQTVCAM